MDIVTGLAGLMIGAVAAWKLRRGCTAGEMSQLRAQMHARIAYWQEETERARANAARVHEQAAAWAAGSQQGREDVISIVHALAHHATGSGDGPAAG
jgi:chitodextrinase